MALTDVAVRYIAQDCFASGRRWQLGLLVDVGSTFTKLIVIDPAGHVVDEASGPTTVGTDVTIGFRSTLGNLKETASETFDWALCCSSAAGGLRMASVGLTARLSGQAGNLAALGSGAKVVATEHGFLTSDSVKRIHDGDPHLVLLAGGIDGGNEDALLHNAQALADLDTVSGFLIAGNARVADHAATLLREAPGHRDQRSVRVVENVFPHPGEVNVAPTREAVRELFMRRITGAKGLTTLLASLKCDCEPTPMSVSRGLAAFGTGGERPVVLVDVGGATTDVHSHGGTRYRTRNVDVPTPDIHRTVEGDIGMRWGAPGVVHAVPSPKRTEMERRLSVSLTAEAEKRHLNPSLIADTAIQREIDEALAQTAVAVAIERHAGHIVIRHQPWGDRHRVAGKDLRACRLLIATGGIFCFLRDPQELLRRALRDVAESLVPRDPEIVIDYRYCAFAIGLVARASRRLATRMTSHLASASVESG